MIGSPKIIAPARPFVSVVIATFDRPLNLSMAIESVLKQTVQDFEIVVVGDHCGPETGEVLDFMSETRVRYVNLPGRCGEQSLPNSVGMAVAKGDVIAFLNHDDLWLPDHLENCLAALKDPSVDFVTSATGFVLTAPQSGNPVVAEISPAGRTLRDAFFQPHPWFEPISSWVMPRETAQIVGPFKPAVTLYRWPVQDWLMRAWRANVGHRDLATITVLKDGTMPRHPGRHSYAEDRLGLAEFTELVLSSPPEVTRATLASNHRAAMRNALPSRSTEPLFREALATLGAEEANAYLKDGIDAYDTFFRDRGFDLGWHMARLLKSRTGERLAPPPPLEQLVSFAKEQQNDC